MMMMMTMMGQTYTRPGDGGGAAQRANCDLESLKTWEECAKFDTIDQ